MYLRTTGRCFTQMIAYFLVMNSKRCSIILYYLRRGSTPVSTDRFKYIFYNIKMSKSILKMVWTRLASYPLQYGNWPWWSDPPIWKDSSATGQYPVWMTQKPRKRVFRKLKSEKFQRGRMPPDLPRTLRFRRSLLENRSVVILDQRLYLISLPSF